MSVINRDPQQRVWTAAQLRRLPPDQRDAVLAAAAERALSDYVSDPSLTDFEAFGEDDLHGDSTDSGAR